RRNHALRWLGVPGYGRFGSQRPKIRCPMAEIIHPFYEQHRGAMEAAMRHRLDLAEAMLCERTHFTNIDGIRQEVMDEFEIVLTQMHYVGGAANRMSDFFMRLTGFMAISRVL